MEGGAGVGHDDRTEFDGGNPWQVAIPPGSYTVTYTAYPDYRALHGAVTVAEDFIVTDAATLDVDIALVDVSVSATLDGGQAPGAIVRLLGATSHAWGTLDDNGSATLRVPAGTYAAQFDLSGLGTASPWATLHPRVSVTGG